MKVTNEVYTKAGRLLTSEFAPQNIPIRTPHGRQIREAFFKPMPPVDYSQIELRLLAQYIAAIRGKP